MLAGSNEFDGHRRYGLDADEGSTPSIPVEFGHDHAVEAQGVGSRRLSRARAEEATVLQYDAEHPGDGVRVLGSAEPLREAMRGSRRISRGRIDREELQVAVQRMGFQTMDNGVIDEFFTFLAGSNASYIDYVSFSAAIDRVPSNLRACW
jgi:hypothetical protein